MCANYLHEYPCVVVKDYTRTIPVGTWYGRLRQSASNSNASCINHITRARVKMDAPTNTAVGEWWVAGGWWTWVVSVMVHVIIMKQSVRGASFNAGGSVVVVVVVGLLGGAIAMQLTINSNFNGWSLVPQGIAQSQLTRCHAWRCLINIVKYNWRFDVEICMYHTWYLHRRPARYPVIPTLSMSFGKHC